MFRRFRPIAVWSYGLAIVAVGYFARGHYVYWRPDWSKPLPDYQAKRYVRGMQRGDERLVQEMADIATGAAPQLPWRLKFGEWELEIEPGQPASDEAQKNATSLLEQADRLDVLGAEARADHWISVVNTPDPFFGDNLSDAAEQDLIQRRQTRALAELWSLRDLVASRLRGDAFGDAQFDQFLRYRWSVQWLNAADRPQFAASLMHHFGIAANTLNPAGDRQGRRRVELAQAYPVLSTLVAFTPHAAEYTAGDDSLRLAGAARAMVRWWAEHATLTQEEREALALAAIVSGPRPTGYASPYAEWLLNRPLAPLTDEQWRAMCAQGRDWTRLQWVVDGFRQQGIAIAEPWDRADVEAILRTLAAAAESVDQPRQRRPLPANAVWLLERLALDAPPPVLLSWIGPLAAPDTTRQEDWQRINQRWQDWWKRQPPTPRFRDPALPLW